MLFLEAVPGVCRCKFRKVLEGSGWFRCVLVQVPDRFRKVGVDVFVSSFFSPTKNREYVELNWWQREIYQCFLVNNCCRHAVALELAGASRTYGPVFGASKLYWPRFEAQSVAKPPPRSGRRLLVDDVRHLRLLYVQELFGASGP